MPSFIIHNISGNKLLEKLNISDDDKIKFTIGNLLPDSTSIKIDPNWSDIETRHNIQNEKISTHFRTNLNDILEYPDIDYFLSKYLEECKKNIVSFGYLFHLYCDYYYFKYFLPKQITFLDIKGNIVNTKNESIYVRINKSKEEMLKRDFFNHKTNNGLYKEYTRLNKYLLNKYNTNTDLNNLRDYLNIKKINTNIIEINSNNSYQVIDKLESMINDTLKIEDANLKIFNQKEVEEFINDMINSFIKKYDYIIINYK